MKTLVIDVAAEHSGAITILDQFVESFARDSSNSYFVLLSTPSYENLPNVVFYNYKWVKNSPLHRLWFDRVYIRKIIKQIQPDMVLSLQNCAISCCGKKQIVYFQNALPISDVKYSFFESRSIWLYQNVIGKIWKRSLKHVDGMIVQAEWIKEAISKKWGIPKEIISVKSPTVELVKDIVEVKEKKIDGFFYPANGSIYKNHGLLIESMITVWKTKKGDMPSLYLTGNEEILSKQYRQLIQDNKYPVVYLGRLNREQMVEYYSRTILIFPSLIETIGLPLVEAKGLKRQILAADLPYAREVLQNYEKCIYFDPLSKASIVEAIQQACRINNL